MRHSISLISFISLFEERDEVNAVEEINKQTASEWLVESGTSVHVPKCKEDLDEPENLSPFEVEK